MKSLTILISELNINITLKTKQLWQRTDFIATEVDKATYTDLVVGLKYSLFVATEDRAEVPATATEKAKKAVTKGQWFYVKARD